MWSITDLLQVVGDGVVDPREHSAVRLNPRRTVDAGYVDEGILVEDDQEQTMPVHIVVGRSIQNHGREGPMLRTEITCAWMTA